MNISNSSQKSAPNIQVDIIESFRAAAAEYGLQLPEHIIADDLFHHFSPEGKCGGNPPGYYRLRIQADGFAYGHGGDFRDDTTKFTFCSKSREKLTPAEKAEYRKAQEQRDLESAAERTRHRAKMDVTIRAMLKEAEPAPENHPYLMKKGIEGNLVVCGEPLKADATGALLLPTLCFEGEKRVYTGAERIYVEERTGKFTKRMVSGSIKAGSILTISGEKKLSEANTAYIVEGFSTGASICLVTGAPVIVSNGADNLLNAARTAKSWYPGITWIVAGDNDLHLEVAGKPNKGVLKAHEAAVAIGALVAIPDLPSGSTGSDWNDIHQQLGLDAAAVKLMESTCDTTEKDSGSQGNAHSELTGAAEEIMIRIRRHVVETLSFSGQAICQEDQIEVAQEAIHRRLTTCFWSGTKSKLYLLNNGGDLVLFSEKDARNALERTFGSVLDRSDLLPFAETAASQVKSGPKIDANKLLRRCLDGAEQIIIDEIKYSNQRESIDMLVDMFAEEGRVELLDESVRVVYTHKPLVGPAVDRNEMQKTVADFREHFPQFDQFIKFLMAARFARDRKRAYIWFHCPSDWGKGFLIALLAELDAVLEISVKEVEKLFEGGPVGKSNKDFKRAIALVVDEFKSTKSELKQLQNEITVNPKNQLCTRVPVYAKLFFSAEHVPSLAGEHGMEDQFSNRFVYLKGEGILDNRSRFAEIGKGLYFDHLLSYLADQLNLHVAHFKGMGREGAARAADEFIDNFHLLHGIDKSFQRYSQTIPDIGLEIVELLVQLYTDEVAHGPPLGPAYGPTADIRQHLKTNMVQGSDGCWYLCNAGKLLQYWLNQSVDRSEIGALAYKKEQLYQAMSANGNGYVTHRIGEPNPDDNNRKKGVKSVQLQLTDEQLGQLERATRGR
ncbi:DNA primase TraC [Halioglobus japonicus]|nr:DNA primase TraC [Halioglobus japonicus]